MRPATSASPGTSSVPISHALKQGLPLRIELLPRAGRQLRALPSDVRVRIEGRIGMLSDDARPPGVQKLHGTDAYRIRVGDYRVLYTIDDGTQTVTVASVGHRRDIYR